MTNNLNDFLIINNKKEIRLNDIIQMQFRAITLSTKKYFLSVM